MINNNAAFAALDEYGRVYAWGNSNNGGITEDGSYVTVETVDGIKDLSNIVQIYSTQAAFAALDSSGNVYAWGDQAYGGFNIDANTITSTDTNGALTLDANGTGAVNVIRTINAQTGTIYMYMYRKGKIMYIPKGSVHILYIIYIGIETFFLSFFLSFFQAGKKG